MPLKVTVPLEHIETLPPVAPTVGNAFTLTVTVVVLLPHAFAPVIV